MNGPPVDLSFKNITRMTAVLAECPRNSQRPSHLDSKGKYRSRSFRLSYNSLGDTTGLHYILREFLSEPSKLGWLDLSHNKLSFLDDGMSDLPELRVLYLHGNCIWNMRELEKLSVLPHLHSITLHGNPIEHYPHYRTAVIATLPNLKKLDFSLVTHDERVLANVWSHRSNRD